MSVPVAVLAPFAAAMAVATAWLIAWSADAQNPLRAAVFAFLLAMMAGMLVGAVAYFHAPSGSSLLIALWLSGGLMSVAVLPLFAVFVRESRRAGLAAPGDPGPTGVPRGFAPLIVLLVLANEFLMGWAFSLASGAPLPSIGGASTSAFLTSVVVSPWFLFTMAAEMALTAVLLRHRLSREVLAVLLSQAGIMALSPPALADAGWVALSIYLSSAVMIGLFVFVMEYLYRTRQLPVGFSRYLVEVLAVYGLMMAGIFLVEYSASVSLFAVSILLEMVVFYDAVVRPGALSGAPGTPWQLDARWAFAVLSCIFVAEVFMGAVLDVRIDPTVYLGTFPALPLAGPAPAVLFNALSNGFWFLALVTSSTWFLTMMGLEMGALVVLKFRETRHLENKIRLLLMLGSYGAFAVFYPSLYFGLLFPHTPNASRVPMLGWSMGIGSYPLAIGVFGTLLLTYVITGALVVAFGRRAICSVFCTAPLMYQGTTIDAMKSFNRTSQPARKYLSSRFSLLYSVTSGVVMGALVVTSLLSYLDSTGTLSVYVQGADPSVFLFTISFAVLWYVMFVTIPYTGNYSCVTMGWCYTGTIAQAFHKIGFFKLKVRSKEVCRDCTTLDCAKGCPVGLVDMPGHFRSKGEFRSTKCCGVGDCVEACPYDNLYISDLRHWVRRHLGLPEAPPARGSRLPMIAATRGVVAAPAATERGSPVAASAMP